MKPDVSGLTDEEPTAQSTDGARTNGFEDFVLAANEADSPDQLIARFTGAIRAEGFAWFFYLQFGRTARQGFDGWRFLEHNCPAEWALDYTARHCADHDPLLAHSFGSLNGFAWSTLAARIRFNREEKAVIESRAAVGLCDGVSIPIHGAAGDLAVVSFARAERSAPTRRQKAILPVLAYQLHLRYTALSPSRAKPDTAAVLTPREREILLWCSQGKSNGVIADILGISESSVRFHITNTYTKLRVSGRVLAIVEAIKQGLINP